MKSKFQVLAFLRHYKPATDLDRDMITSFMDKRYGLTPKTPTFATEPPFKPINTQTFLKWYESGHASLEIAKHDGSLVILGECDAEEAVIIGKLEEDAIRPSTQTVPPAGLSKASESETATFQRHLLSSRLQPNPKTLRLETKHIPEPAEKVLFHSLDMAKKGVGVVRLADPEADMVDFFCLFIYPIKTEQGRLGHALHNTDAANLSGYVYEPLLEDDNRFSDDDGISAYRRLKSELKKAGKVWKDKIRRIEPSKMKRDRGEKYWYITDKLDVVYTIDKWTPTSQMRYLSGNYFPTLEAATKTLGKLQEAVREYLASTDWPEME